MGRAATLLPLKPFVSTAAKSELIIASSVASIAAINSGEFESLGKIKVDLGSLFVWCNTLFCSNVEKAIT